MPVRRGWCQEWLGNSLWNQRHRTITICRTLQQHATMLSTTWRTIRALGFPALDSLGSRPFSLCRVSGSWYKNLDQDARTAHRKKTREHFLERLSANPEIRDADYRRFKLRYKEDEHYRCYRCYRYPWLREQLPWKTHRPILYDRKVEHYCNACEWARTSGTKLW